MANPYPMQGQQMMPQQQPMGGAPAPTGPTSAPRPVVRQGTSKAVPVVVSAGLAIGVFCGLLFGVGIPDDTASASTTTTASNDTKKPDDEVPAPFQPERKDVKVPSLAPQTVKDGSVSKDGSASKDAGSAASKDAGSAASKDAGSAASKDAGSGSGAKDAGSAAKPQVAPTKVVGNLKVEIQPDTAAKIAKVSIDGKDIDGLTYELDMSDLVKAKPDAKHDDIKKELKVTVKASGFIDRTSKVEVVADRDTTLKIDLVKRGPTGGGQPRINVPNTGNTGGTKPPPPKCKKPPCGLIDI